MSTAVFAPSRLCGRAAPPASKSEAHRALLTAALGADECSVTGLGSTLCDDTKAMISGIRALGADVRFQNSTAHIAPSAPPPKALCDVKDCAAALRMLIPAFLAKGINAEIAIGEGLYNRPLGAFEPLISRLGARLELKPPEKSSRARVFLEGFMPAGEYTIDGSVSSQFVSGMLIALAHAADRNGKPAASRLTVTGMPVSRPYIDMTLDMLRRFGAECSEHCGVFDISPRIAPSPGSLAISGDWSQAAVLLCANALGGSVTLEGMEQASESPQGDSQIIDILRRMGMRISRENGAIVAVMPSDQALCPIDLNCEDIPDIAPLIALICARANGRSALAGISRLRIKESDRLATLCGLLSSIGAQAELNGGELIIVGGKPFKGGFTFDARGDHRMVMLAATAALAADSPIEVIGADAVAKSWPDFLDTYRSLGGVIL